MFSYKIQLYFIFLNTARQLHSILTKKIPDYKNLKLHFILMMKKQRF